jgi:O-antigen ligase
MALIGRSSFLYTGIAEARSAIYARIRPHRVLLLRLALALGVLIGAPVVGVLTLRVNPILVFIVPCLLLVPVGLQFVLNRPSMAPLIILVAAAFLPISISTGTGSNVVDSLLLTMCFVGIWILRMLMVEKRFRLAPSPMNKPLLGFMAIVVLSLLWSTAFRDPLVTIWRTFPVVQLASTAVMLMLPGAFLLVANYLNDAKSLKAMVALMLFGGAVGLIKRYAFDSLPVNVEGLFTMWIVTLTTGLAFFNRELSRVQRGLLLAMAGGFIYWGFRLHIDWLAGWLPGFVALGVLSFMRSKKLFAILIVLLLTLIVIRSDYYLSTIQNEDNQSGSTRLAAWQVNWRITGQHLLLGTGPAGYAAYYMSYFPNSAMATHSNYVDIIAQTGIVGLGLCMWFFFTLAWQGYNICLRLHGRADFLEGLANAAFAGTVSCIVAMAFGDWLFPFAYTQTIAGFDYAVYSWLFMGVIPVLDRLAVATSEVAPSLGD